MRDALLILYFVAVFILTVANQFSVQDIQNYVSNATLASTITFLFSYKVFILTICSLYITAERTLPKWVLPQRSRNKLKEQFLKRINTELLGNDPIHHRVTLFREVCYLRAFVKNCSDWIKHLACENSWRAPLYFNIPKRGRYLIIDSRYGSEYQKSSTMFRIDKNNANSCVGVAGYIRFHKLSLHLSSLPDINDIDFKTITSIDEVPQKKKALVRKYLKQGMIKDFENLRKLHWKARHFYGTIITKKDGTPWGVLLVDSINEEQPFTLEVRARFDSFAISISGIISMEV